MDEAGSSAGGGVSVSGFRPGVDSLDEPPNSRIFLVISKYTPEAVLRERFSPFGEIQDIWVVRDKHTKESKGIAFIKFARSSQACRAMEEMHGQCLEPNNTKPIKVRGTRGAALRGGAAGCGSPGPALLCRGEGGRVTTTADVHLAAWEWGEDPHAPESAPRLLRAPSPGCPSFPAVPTFTAQAFTPACLDWGTLSVSVCLCVCFCHCVSVSLSTLWFLKYI